MIPELNLRRRKERGVMLGKMAVGEDESVQRRESISWLPSGSIS